VIAVDTEEITEVLAGDILEVAWEDAWADLGVFVPEGFDATWPRFTWAICVQLTDDHLVLATDYSLRDDSYSQVNVIPRAWITGVRVLGRLHV